MTLSACCQMAERGSTVQAMH